MQFRAMFFEGQLYYFPLLCNNLLPTCFEAFGFLQASSCRRSPILDLSNFPYGKFTEVHTMAAPFF